MSFEPLPDQVCRLCGARSRLIAGQLGVCASCIRDRSQEALALTDVAHAAARRLFDLPERPPRAAGGRRCGLCVQDCVIGEGERGYCGLCEVRDGKLHHLAGTPARGLLHWYRDPLPTNCVADPFCSGHAQRGKPSFTPPARWIACFARTGISARLTPLAPPSSRRTSWPALPTSAPTACATLVAIRRPRWGMPWLPASDWRSGAWSSAGRPTAPLTPG